MLKLFQNSLQNTKKTVLLNQSLKNTVKFQNQFYGFCSENNNNNKHKDAFNNLKDKIKSENSDSKIKMDYYKDMLKNAKDQVNEKINNIDTSKIQEKVNIQGLKDKIQSLNNKNTNNNNNQNNNNDNQNSNNNENSGKQDQQQQNIQEQQQNEETIEKKENQEPEKVSKFDEFQEKNTYAGQLLKFGVSAWKQTFPNENDIAIEKLKKAKEAARKLREEEELKKEYSEEELEKMQEALPEWKKQSLQTVEQKQQKESLSQKLKGNVKSKFNKTEFAKDLYKSEEYKEYETFRKDMSEFKEDLKDHVHNSPSQIVQGSLYVMEKATSETTVARSIREMRKYDPDFDIHELEKETRVIFEQAFNDYLQSDVEALEKYCGEQALGYFKALIKKRETENSVPKYKTLWSCERGQFDKAYFPDHLPVFAFTIKMQEIYCNICKKTGKIVDGDEDRIMGYDYLFVLRLHGDPDIEEVGHKWEIVELQPRMVTKMLV